MNLHRTTCTILAVTALAACTADESLPQVDVGESPAPQERRAGSLLAEHRVGENGTSVHAQFLDIHGVSPEAALDALEIWTPDRELDIDACSIRPRLSTRADSETVRLDLLDVGTIGIRPNGHQEVRLEGRRLPDLMSSFAGVVYGNEQGYDFEEAFVPFQPNAPYVFEAPGTDAAGGFSVMMTAPSPAEIYAAGGDFVLENRNVSLRSGEDLSFAWTLTDETSGAELYLDLTGSGGPDRLRLRCHLEDDGHFTIPGTILEQISDDHARLELALRRVHVSNVEIDGLETAEFVFAATDELSIDIQ